MPISRFPAGVSSFGVPVIPITSNMPAGNVFYVCSVQSPDSGASWLAGVDASSSGDKATPFATINYASTLCKADNGDVIYVLPGHVESITTAGGLTFNVSGVKVLFLGEGSLRGTINFGATAATMLVSATNVNLYNPRFLTGIDAVVSAIKVQAADFKMFNAEYYDAAAKASTIQLLTTSAANRMVIDGYKYFASTTGTQKTDGLKIVGGDGIILRNIDISGDFSVSNIDNATTLVTNILLENIKINNTNSGPQPALTLQATSTGFANNVKCRVASGTTFVSSAAKIQWGFDCEGFATDGYNGVPLGTLNLSSVVGSVGTLTNTGGTATLGGILGDVANMAVATRGRLRKSIAVAAAGLTGTTTRWTVAGSILVYNLGVHITTVLPAGANTLKFSFTPTGGAATDLCGATDTASAAAEQIFIVNGVKATGLVKTTDVGIAVNANFSSLPIMLSNGVIQTIFSAGPPASGAGTLFIEYEMCESGATLT